MNTLAYLVYGPKREYQLELSYSVLSAVHEARTSDATPPHIALISDEANRRSDLPIDSVVISPSEFDRWTRGGKYHHEAKVHALDKAVNLFQGKVALIDTDTYFRANPERLFERIGPQRSVMHAHEGLVGNIAYLAPLLKESEDAPGAYPLSRDTRSFNSGVVGLDYADRALLPDVLRLLHQLHEIYAVFSVEQLAFSIVLDRATRLVECADLVTHYYGYERGFNHLQIAQLFPQFTAERFQAHTEAMPRINGFPRKRLLDQLRARWKSRTRGEGLDYRFAYLACLSARSSVPHAPDQADIWAQIAVDVLRRNPFRIAHVWRDFYSMRELDAQPWAGARTRQLWSSYWRELAEDQKLGQLRTTVQP